MTSDEQQGLFAPTSYNLGEELPCTDWGVLEEGQFVMVQRSGEPILPGQVDVICPDASVFWIWLDRGRGRIAIYADEGTIVWLPSRAVHSQPEVRDGAPAAGSR